MSEISDDLKKRYRSLDSKVTLLVETEDAIRSDLLIAFPYDHPDREAGIKVETEEFSAVCPWTGQPDLGTLRVEYTPHDKLLELKSYKYYLTSYRSVGIVQENAAARILKDLVKAIEPIKMSVVLDYRIRGGIATTVTLDYP